MRLLPGASDRLWESISGHGSVKLMLLSCYGEKLGARTKVTQRAFGVFGCEAKGSWGGAGNGIITCCASIQAVWVGSRQPKDRYGKESNCPKYSLDPSSTPMRD